ncbi:hypothetical protein [Acetobacter senegalensis]|uniref:hypothetical protein n=1 Tax=Acetobacter senegalensis TaxID=446692 RepID=UPI001EDB2582|nr:hypothetical protein [Acetobacter senegalensis]MCG4256886.1 hypothetical protein [Acetobacter senegalensis]MCG4266976.1 hypothetical protein [Acetobacter senegalensis]
MRTREEQIEVETDIISKVVKEHIKPATCKSFVHRLIMEAERRAEQRVRAEIGRPVYQFKSGVSYWTDTTEIFYEARVLQGQEVRKLYRAETIDAAREVG